MNYHSAVSVLRSSIDKVVKTLSKSEWRTSEETAALNAMKEAYDASAILEVDSNAEKMVGEIREVLWCNGKLEFCKKSHNTSKTV